MHKIAKRQIMYLDPADIVVEFLRARLTDPSTRTYTTNADSFTATSGQTEFQLTPSSGYYSHTTSITVDAAAQTKWEDYYIDTKDQKIIFFTGLTTGQTVIVNYKSGTTNWIYSDKPNTKINISSFPRISVITVGNVGIRLGSHKAKVEANIRFQMSNWAKEKSSSQIFTISSKAYAGEDLANYLAYQITKSFEDYESDLFPALYGYDPVGMPRSLPFDIEYQAHHKIVECILKGISVGRIS